MAADDIFEGYSSGLEAPASDGAEITPNDTNDVPHVTRGLYVGTGGAIRVTLKSGAVATFANIGSGTLLPLRAHRVWATGTTASDLVVLW